MDKCVQNRMEHRGARRKLCFEIYSNDNTWRKMLPRVKPAHCVRLFFSENFILDF